LGARSLKAGHTRFFVGYKKHTLRLWLRRDEPTVLLVPRVSWATPAHVPEGYLLRGSIRQWHRRLGWRPDIVVGDLGYIHQQTKKEIRQEWQVAVVTKLKSDMNIIEPFDAWDQMSCSQGQPLHWLGDEESQALHWFGVPPDSGLCPSCWHASRCLREFSYPPEHHETLLGLLPLNTMVASRLLTQVRSWIEPCQAVGAERDVSEQSAADLDDELVGRFGRAAAGLGLAHHSQGNFPIGRTAPRTDAFALKAPPHRANTKMAESCFPQQITLFAFSNS
jgi:hypothetical protein